MGALRTALAVTLGALLMLSVLPFAAADGGSGEELQFSVGPMGVNAEEGRLVVHNGNVTVWFQEYRPMVHIFTTGDNGTATGFTVAVRGIYEIDSAGLPVAMLDMNRPYPITNMTSDGLYNYTASVRATYDASVQTIDVAFNLTANEFLVNRTFMTCDHAPAPDGSGMQSESPGPASVSVIFHISAEKAFVKFDLIVSHWTWADTSGDRLALAATIDGHEITDNFGQRPSVEGVPVGENNGDATQLRYTVHNTYYRDSVRILGTDLMAMGYLTWASNATVTYADRSTATAGVTAFMYNCSNDESAAARLLLVFAVPQGMNTDYSTLEYDPVTGLGQLMPRSQDQGAPGNSAWFLPYVGGMFVVIALTIAAVGLVALAAVVLLRRK